MTPTDVGPDAAPDRRRRLGWPMLVGLLVVFALLPSFVAVFAFGARSNFSFPDQETVTHEALTVAIGLLVVVAFVSWLRWWPEVLHEQLRTGRWVWLVPASILAVSIALADYGRMREAGAAIIGTLLLAVLFIAAGEELLFRGVVLLFLRGRQREAIAAMLSSLMFGLIHFPAGPVQVVSSMVFGYLLYLTRRVSGGLVLPIAVHAAWDFSVFTSATTATPSSGSNASVALALLSVVLLVVVAVAHRRIDVPAQPDGPAAA